MGSRMLVQGTLICHLMAKMCSKEYVTSYIQDGAATLVCILHKLKWLWLFLGALTSKGSLSYNVVPVGGNAANSVTVV